VCQPKPVSGEQSLDDLLDSLDGAKEDGRDNACLLLVLDGVTDPHNLGACLRSAAAMGVDALIAPRDRAVGLTPAAVKVASGGADLVPMFQVTNLARTLDGLKERGIWTVGLSAESEQTVMAVDLVQPVALVLGAEGSGLRRLTAKNCDFLAQIPLSGPGVSTGVIDSLNVSVAAGICLYEACRQRALVRP
jgi:23S rRNA (guanosine2251-2'-O)-methyltransferase